MLNLKFSIVFVIVAYVMLFLGSDYFIHEPRYILVSAKFEI